MPSHDTWDQHISSRRYTRPLRRAMRCPIQRQITVEFLRFLAAQGATVRVGMEASGDARWFERLLGN